MPDMPKLTTDLELPDNIKMFLVFWVIAVRWLKFWAWIWNVPPYALTLRFDAKKMGSRE
jgi:hypothetical protein